MRRFLIASALSFALGAMVCRSEAGARRPAIAAGVQDRGVFGDLDPEVGILIPAWLRARKADLQIDLRRRLATLRLGGLPVKVYPLGAAAGGPSGEPRGLSHLGLRPPDLRELEALPGGPPALHGSARGFRRDRDRDGIPDPVDVLLGALKAAENGARYQRGYLPVAYPGGDISRKIGVCTDVVVRAFRNAGLDLQSALFRDMRDHRRRYGLRKGKRPDRNIEHRRVRRLIRYFSAYFRPLPTSFDRGARGDRAWLPGDLVFFDTFPGRRGPDHVGVVSDRLGPSGQPLVINNWTEGFHTQEMDLLSFVPVTHRFRIGLRKGRAARR